MHAPSLPDVWDLQHEWDRRYLDSGAHPWGLDPHPAVVDVVSSLQPGDALDLGAGDGRHARWLASTGWRVTAVDICPLALAQLREDAWGLGWDLVTIHADLRTWTPDPDRADLVVMSFIQLAQPFRERLHRLVARTLRPGGTLVMVGRDPSEVVSAGEPPCHEPLPTVRDIEREFAGLLVERAGVVLRETAGGAGHARDVVLVARRPPWTVRAAS